MHNNKRGFVLPAVLFALVILGVVAMATLWSADDEQRSGKAFKESGVALYAAEAGLRNTLGNLPGAALWALAPGDSVVVGSGWTSLPNRSKYRAVIYRVDNLQLQQYAVFVHGTRPGVGGSATISAVVSGIPIFKWGIFSQGTITMSGGSQTDGYNSFDGPYNPAAHDSTGSIATNGSIVLSGGGTMVQGDATAVGANSGATVTGTRTAGAPPFPPMPTLSCPASYTPNALIPGGPGISYNGATGALAVSGGKNITLSGGTYYFSQLVLSGNSTLTTTGGSVVIYVDDKVDLSGGTVVNTSTIPSNLSVMSCGTASTTGWNLSGGSGAYFSVYAPNHPVTISGAGNIYGAIVGATLTSSGGSHIHYDAALTQVSSKQIRIVPGSWTELSAY